MSKLSGLIVVLVSTILLSCQLKPEDHFLIETEVGDILIEVYAQKAPVTVANFVRYVELDEFEGANFYRVVRMDNQPNNDVRIEVIQGNFTVEENDLGSILHESTDQTGILHQDGTISMARLEPGSASLAFFICIGDQPELDFGGKRNPDGQGFAAFGKVIGGMDVVRKIQMMPSREQQLLKEIDIKRISVQK